LGDLDKVPIDLAGNYALGADIDTFGGPDNFFTPIGSDATPFTGQFDGRGHTISSLTVHSTDGSSIGLFGTLGQSAVVRDLSVNGRVTSFAGGNEGILAGENYGTILRVNTSGTVTDPNLDNNSIGGGLVGENLGTIERSSSSAFVDAAAAGGLVGLNYNGLISQSHASGQVQGVGGVEAGAGGLVGNNFGGTITGSYATGLVRNDCYGGCSGAAGLVYENYWGTISQSYATGTVDVTGCSDSGCAVGAGLVWRNDNGIITQSYATGEVIALGCATGECSGGSALVGYNLGAISESFATGQVIAASMQSPTGPTVASAGIAIGNAGVIGNDVYWNKDTTTTSTGVYSDSGNPIPPSNGLTTAQMSNPASFSGWDFSSTGAWIMPLGADHPYLRWQAQPPL
jgi:hypothetical protein